MINPIKREDPAHAPLKERDPDAMLAPAFSLFFVHSKLQGLGLVLLNPVQSGRHGFFELSSDELASVVRAS